MTLGIEEKKALIAYRLQKAYTSLTEARDKAQLGALESDIFNSEV